MKRSSQIDLLVRGGVLEGMAARASLNHRMLGAASRQLGRGLALRLAIAKKGTLSAPARGSPIGEDDSPAEPASRVCS